ncbi:hypothetical protein SDC9_176151 [bioreactor metagenome]|uniref:Uncharacterized protein n=1 Tax=bioreactor metagenome TaxID=1076179 RepID=A0A645GR94_9ZZZZ
MQTPEMTPNDLSNDLSGNATTPIYVNNAGIALAVPYFTRLFNMLKLTENNKFTGIDTQIRAACLIRYITHPGKGYPEAEMQLNKLLTSLPANQLIPSVFEVFSIGTWSGRADYFNFRMFSAYSFQERLQTLRIQAAPLLVSNGNEL